VQAQRLQAGLGAAQRRVEVAADVVGVDAEQVAEPVRLFFEK
jgi:hypothetical protein